MPEPGEYSDTLRVVGRWLQQQGARNVEIIDEGTHLGVSWEEPRGTQVKRLFRAFQLAQLRNEARLLRVDPDQDPGTTLAETLRAIGDELDRLGHELLSIIEDATGFRISAMAGGRHVIYGYSHEQIPDLIMKARARRRVRARLPTGARPSR